jgi:hypothetical protein
MRPSRLLPLLAALALGLPGLACRSAYYGTLETFGVHKREILVDRVDEAREGQQEAKERFQSTYDAFVEVTGFQGGDLEERYDDLRNELERSEIAAKRVRARIESVRGVGDDLFDEWDEEIEEIQSPELRSKSETLRRDTHLRYEALVRAMEAASAKMDPVLVSFRDNVLFLKHNLNARAIASLRDTVLGIEDDVAALLRDMQSSIDQAEDFIRSMESEA